MHTNHMLMLYLNTHIHGWGMGQAFLCFKGLQIRKVAKFSWFGHGKSIPLLWWSTIQEGGKYFHVGVKRNLPELLPLNNSHLSITVTFLIPQNKCCFTVLPGQQSPIYKSQFCVFPRIAVVGRLHYTMIQPNTVKLQWLEHQWLVF